MIFSKELEKLAEEHANEMGDSVEYSFKAGWHALENLIMKSGESEFNETECIEEFNKKPPYLCGQPCEHSYVEGARYKHEADQLIIGGLRTSLAEKDRVNEMLKIEIDEQLGEIQKLELLKEDHALKAELSEKIAYIEQLEKASDTQSNQYHQMRENLESIIEKQKAEYNDILEPIFQDKLKKLELENAALKEKLDLALSGLKFYATKQHYYLQAGMGERISDTGGVARETLQKIGKHQKSVEVGENEKDL